MSVRLKWYNSGWIVFITTSIIIILFILGARQTIINTIHQESLKNEIDSLKQIVSSQDTAYLELIKERNKINHKLSKISLDEQNKKIKKLEEEIYMLRHYRDTVIYLKSTPDELLHYFKNLISK